MNNAGVIALLVINKTPPKHRRMEKRTKKDRESAGSLQHVEADVFNWNPERSELYARQALAGLVVLASHSPGVLAFSLKFTVSYGLAECKYRCGLTKS